VLHMDVEKVDRGVAHVAIAIHVCCTRLFKVYHLFFRRITYVASVLSGCCICFSHRCCKRFFEMFHPFHMHVASVLSRCHICFTQMLYAFVPNISYVLDVCTSKFFLVLQVFSCFKHNRTARVT
jgi:hypothetical protein